MGLSEYIEGEGTNTMGSSKYIPLKILLKQAQECNIMAMRRGLKLG